MVDLEHSPRRRLAEPNALEAVGNRISVDVRQLGVQFCFCFERGQFFLQLGRLLLHEALRARHAERRLRLGVERLRPPTAAKL